MATDIMPYMQRLLNQFDVPNIRESFTGFEKTLQFNFTDTDQHFVIAVANDGSAAMQETTIDNADVTITTTTDVMAGIMDKKVNGVTAYMTRKIKVNGNMEDLNRLQKLMF
jgi:putative sterol carrier protein